MRVNLQFLHVNNYQTVYRSSPQTQCAAAWYLLIPADDSLRFDPLFESKTHLFLLKSSFFLTDVDRENRIS